MPVTAQLKPYSSSVKPKSHDVELGVLKAEKMHIGDVEQPLLEVSLQILLGIFQRDLAGARNQVAGSRCIAIA